MFIVKYHDEAEQEIKSLPAKTGVKLARLIGKLETDPRSLREPNTKPIGGGLYEIRTMGGDIARGLWVYQTGKQIYLLRVFIKKTQKIPPSEIALAFHRLEEMKHEEV
ncbi:type II toxin-antitoxin system RelE/ParE family toxin [Photorhabdus noenieputensis]|uniref:type II toxin-antitoxin system RelE/ParE family toxin n=1 Tax=Photorhabdus noenieputensis TaxID=1208607 RepID=UPI001BD6BCE4|nr:type II toxin-antitoxin system RelE/ParE family toxin [Photorhabdus noenieputensis]MBS9435677.1 type II toxin-antitoxin system RelE/ParE family toxin [Photorhabdus noenieputensis]MCK3667761.1 type II toxin-antitoxin system RelE/ParE family toxin [Photorhabdus noenieputensis]